MGLAEDIAEEYPFLAFLAGDPEIGPLLAEAVNPTTEWSENRFQAKLMTTNYYKTHSAGWREQEVLAATDPATYWAQAEGYADELRSVASEMGASLNDGVAFYLTQVGLNKGWAPNSASMKKYLASQIDPVSVLQGYGGAGVAANQFNELARGQWFQTPGYGLHPLQSYANVTKMATDIVLGADSLESMNARFQRQAEQWFPHLAPELQQGMTLADIFNPYRELISQELELGGAENVDMSETGKWRHLMSYRDPKNNEVRLPTESEVRTMARSEPTWWNTSKGRQSDAQGANTLLQMFGKKK